MITLFAQTAGKVKVASDYVNGEIPRWLTLSGEERVRVESFHGAGFGDAGDGYLLNRLRLDVGVRATGWLRFQFEGQDARVFGQNTRPAPAAQRNPMDLRLGYVELGYGEGPVQFRGGRQGWVFGEGRLLADPKLVQCRAFVRWGAGVVAERCAEAGSVWRDHGEAGCGAV